MVNKYSSRSFNDNGQYPIFPWLLIKDYDKIVEINQINGKDKLIEKFYNNKGKNVNINKKTKKLLKSLRNLKYSIIIQTEEKRNSYIQKYSDEDEKFKYHLGIHYSTSSYIYYYLMREDPYSNLLIKLQNYQQENPNRMFLGILETITLLENSKDPREIIPEFFIRFEYLINLNCHYFGIKSDEAIVDDNLIHFFEDKKDYNPFYQYINFIIEHHKLLNSKIISININDWIDNIFGINQLPSNPKTREKCCNIFMRITYEQEINLKQKLNKYLNKMKNNEETPKNALKKITSKINSILNFGQTPYQIFKEKHYKRKLEKEKVDKIGKKKNNEDESSIIEGYEVETVLEMLKTKSITYEMRGESNYIYFDINPNISKIFVISEERNIEIISTQLFSNKRENQYSLSYHDTIKMPYFLFNEKIRIELTYQYYIYNLKYAFSSFDDIDDEKINYKNINTKTLFHTYGREIIDNILIKKVLNKEKINEKNINKKIDLNENLYYKFISCRYIDKSFKIHCFPKYKNNKNIKYLPISFVCEDIVSSCCTISFCQFLIGLKNGKLIQFYIEREEKTKNCKESFKIKMEKYIQAHNGKINVIEINKKLGIIITSGDDNYILIRKLYDFELLTPIKIKKKFIITMVKVSPLHFIYIICYNKEKRESILFGYTLTGLKFAKSKYGFYDNIDFTLNGNIVTLINHQDLSILSGSDLKTIKMNTKDSDYEDFVKKHSKVKNSIWMRYNYFIKENDEENIYTKIITYYQNEDKKITTLDVSNNKYFV